MKNFMIIFTIIAFLAPSLAMAHPGRTAGDGCHYCRTNCDKWGVPWGKRHCHGRAESHIEKVSNDKYKGRVYGLEPYTAEGGWPETVAKYKNRLKELEVYRRRAAEIAIDRGRCDYASDVQVSWSKGSVNYFVFWIDCVDRPGDEVGWKFTIREWVNEEEIDKKYGIWRSEK